MQTRKRIPKNTVAGAVKAFAAQASLHEPTMPLNNRERFHFNNVLTSREADSWFAHHLTTACLLAKAMARLEQMYEQVEKEGQTYEDERGRIISHPLLNQTMSMANSVQSLTRTLGLSASQRGMAGGEQAKRNMADKQAREVIERASTEEDLIKVPTRGERVLEFIKRYCLTPEGSHVGKPLELAPFQQKFILDIYDNPHGTRQAILSIARKNGKSGLISAILLAHLIGPERKQNAQLVAGALSRDQASLVYNLAEKMLLMQPAFNGLYRVVPSSKRIVGLKANTEFRALAADGTKAHGLSPVLALLDEVGQIVGPTTPFVDAILTSQGAHEAPLTILISTQASSDSDFLSLRIDDARRSSDPHVVCHVYEADKDCDIMDKAQWAKSNPALGLFRSEKDLEEQLKQAQRIPAIEASARNLLLNQRVALESMWLAPSVWKENSGIPDLEIFRDGRTVAIGLDLSSRNDLTAAVMSAKDDDGVIHLIPYVFAPERGMEERANRDRAPYPTWVREGKMVAVPGASIDYEFVATWLRIQMEELNIRPDIVAFDRWRITQFKSDAERVGFVVPIWQEVGQGFRDASPRMEFFESLLLQNKLRHGGHPLLNLAASHCVAEKDAANNRKPAKNKSSQKIDPLVAAIMSVGAFMVEQSPTSVEDWIV